MKRKIPFLVLLPILLQSVTFKSHPVSGSNNYHCPSLMGCWLRYWRLQYSVVR